MVSHQFSRDCIRSDLDMAFPAGSGGPAVGRNFSSVAAMAGTSRRSDDRAVSWYLL